MNRMTRNGGMTGSSKKWVNRHVAVAAALALTGTSLLPRSANAANGTWTGGAGTTTWSTAGNWSGGVPGTGNTATFNAAAGSGGAVISNAGVTLGTLLFDTSSVAAYTIGSGAVGSQTLTLDNGGAVTVNATVANNELINAAVTLGANTNAATSFTFTNNSTSNTLTFAGNITAGASTTAAMTRTLTVGGAGNMTLSGVLANGTNETLRLSKTGAGTVMLAGASTYTGTTYMGGGEGTFQIGNGSTGSLNGTTGTALVFSASGTVNFKEAANSSQGMGALTFSGGDGTLQSTYTGTPGTNVTTLTFTSMAARTAGATRNFVISGGTNGTDNKIVLTGVAAGFMDQASFFGGDNYAWMNGAGTYVRGLNWGVDTGSTTTAGGTSLAAATYAQTTADVTAQTTATFTALNIVNTANSAQAFTLASGQTVTTNGILRSGNGGASSVTTISGGTGIKAASNAELVIRTDQAGDLVTINTPILANGTSSLTKSGAGTLMLSGSNTYTGATSVNGGTLILTNGAGLSTGGLIYNGGNLVFDSSVASHSYSIAYLAGNSPNVNLALQDNASTPNPIALTINGSTNTTYNGVISGTGSLTKTGSSILTLTNTNTFSGGTTLASGTLAIFPSTTNALGSGTLTITGGSMGNNYDQGTMTVPNRQIWNGDFGIRTSSSNLYATGDITLGGNRTIGFNSIYSANWSGVISDGGSNYSLTLQHNGYGGTISLSGANTFGGGVTFKSNSGNASNTIFQIGNLGTSSSNSALGTGTFTIGPVSSGAAPIVIQNTAGAGTLQTNNAMVWNADFTFGGSNNLDFGTGNVSLGTAAGTNRTLTVNNTLTVGGIISNGTTATALTKAGAGTLALGGANTYTGATTINAGVLQLNNTNALQNSAVTVSATNGLKFNAGLGSANVAGLNGASNFALQDTAGTPAAIALNVAGGGTYSGILSAAGSLTKSNSGTFTLTGVNTYSGATSITGGTLAITGSGSINGTSGITINGGTLQYSSSTALTQPISFSGTGGTVVMDSSSTYSGAMTVASGNTLGGHGTLSGTVTIDTGATLSPGNSPGQITVGTLILNSGSTSHMEIGGTNLGTDYDNVTITSNNGLTYGGLLEVVSYGGYDLTQAGSYNLFTLNSGTPSGDFSNVTVGGTTLANSGGVWTGISGGSTYQFTEASGILTVTIPEPATASLMLGVASLGLMARRRRRL